MHTYDMYINIYVIKQDAAVGCCAAFMQMRTSQRLSRCMCWQVQKKKIWEAVQPDLRTDGDRRAGYKGMLMQTSAGSITSASLAAASIS